RNQMPEDNPILSYIGAEQDFESPEKAKEWFDQTYIKRENIGEDEEIAKTITGKRIGALETFAKSKFKEHGVEFEKGSFEGKKVEDILDMGFKKLSETYSKKLEELKENGRGSADKQKQELVAANEKLANDYNELKKLHEGLQSTMQEKETNWASELKNQKIEYRKTDLFGKLKLRPNMNDFEKAGFQAMVNGSLQFDLEGEDLIVRAKDGKRIPNPEKAGA